MNKMFTRLLVLMVALTVMTTPVFSAMLPVTPSTEPPATAVKAAVSEFNNLSKKEKKDRVKEVKKAIKNYKADKRAGVASDTNTLLLVILAILLPPLAVYLHEGTINNRFWISLLLTLLFWVPGVIYALIVVLGD